MGQDYFVTHQRSPVRHSYNGARAYNPSVNITYAPRVSFDGGPFQVRADLAEQSVWTTNYNVREAQTVLVPPTPDDQGGQ